MRMCQLSFLFCRVFRSAVRRTASYLRSYQARLPRTMPKAAPDVAFSDTSARMWDKMRKKCRFFLQLLCVLH